MLPIGTIVTCPECSTEQIKSTKELKGGQQMSEAQWESLGFNMSSMSASCYKCGSKFVRQHPKTFKTQIHLKEDGWVPLSKEK